MSELDRREFVAASTVVVTGGLAGCIGNDGGGGGGGDETESPTSTGTGTETGGDGGEFTENEQRVVDFLTSDPATDNFEDSFDDALDEGSVTVKVGAEGNDGNFAFDPPAVRVSTGTTVTWEWTGMGGAHNVSSTSDSDFEFRSGDAVDSADETFEKTLDATGAALYHCEPHRSVGMKGGIVVEE